MDKNNTKKVLATINNTSNAEKVLNELSAKGYDATLASVVMKDSGQAKEVSENTGANYAEEAVEGAGSGAVTGGAIGAIGGLLAGIGAFVIPGGFLIGGPLVAALGLTGAAATTVSGAVTGAAAGGVVGALLGLGVAQQEAQNYENAIKEGNILLYLPVENIDEQVVRSVLENNGAENINTVG